MNHAIPDPDKPRSYNGDYMEIGREGEEIVMDYLRKNPAVCGIEDFRNIRQIHEADIDCALRLYVGTICLVEIKTDTWLGTTPYVLCEVLRINHTSDPEYAGYLGWTLRSPAKYLLYYAPNRKPPAIYKGTFAAVRRVIQRYTKINDPKWQITRTDKGKTTYNILIPANEFSSVLSIEDIVTTNH